MIHSAPGLPPSTMVLLVLLIYLDLPWSIFCDPCLYKVDHLRSRWARSGLGVSAGPRVLGGGPVVFRNAVNQVKTFSWCPYYLVPTSYLIYIIHTILWIILHDWIFDIFFVLSHQIMLHFDAKATNITPNFKLLKEVYHSLYLCLQIKKTVLLFY